MSHILAHLTRRFGLMQLGNTLISKRDRSVRNGIRAVWLRLWFSKLQMGGRINKPAQDSPADANGDSRTATVLLWLRVENNSKFRARQEARQQKASSVICVISTPPNSSRQGQYQNSRSAYGSAISAAIESRPPP